MRIWDCDGRGEMERRHSTASDSSTDSRQNKWNSCYISRYSSNEGLEGGRITKTMSPKVAVNPLQFVKVGPCDLYRSAQEQLKKVEEIKKAKKEHKDETEDWQSNLDNWKCSRRKRQEHIIERVVEVKKLEQEEHDRNRRRSKTFSEMMQERNTRGRKTSLPVWNDDSDDLSDLGLQSKNDSSSEGERGKEFNGNSEQDSSLSSEVNGDNEKCFNDSEETSKCQEKSKPLPDSEEYTYERAIQSYVNFAETRVRSRSSKSIYEDSKEAKKGSPPIPAKPKRLSITKIDNYISQIESNKNKAKGDSSESVKKNVALPKVDVHKRRELFEKFKETEDGSKINKTSDVQPTKTIKERLSSLEKHQENVDSSRTSINSNVNNRNGIKDRLTNIEKISSNSNFVPRRSSEPLSSQSIKERLSSFEKSKVSPPKNTSSFVEPTVSIKERLNSLHSSCEKEPAKTVIPSVDPTFNEKLSNFKGVSGNSTYQNRAFSPDEIYNKREQHFRHRSLDSLDINQENMSNGSFERVQSLEDLDYRNYPASTFSGDTDREDSGIHTADVSSSVSQADDYDLHLDGNILDDVKMNHQPPIEEESKLVKSELNNEEPMKNVSEEENNVAKSLTSDSSLSEALPPILENPLEPITASSPLVEDPFVNSYPSPATSWSSHCNNFQVPEDGIGEPASHSVETYDNKHLINEITTCAETNYKGDVERTSSEIDKQKDLADKVCHNAGSNDPMPSSEFDPLHASFSDKPEEKCEMTIQENRNEFESTVLSCSEGQMKYESNDKSPLTCTIENSSSGSELPVYKLNQPTSILPLEKLQLDINVSIVNQLTDVILESDPACLFPLSPNVLEPPKEKPPPPPIENSDDENDKVPSKAKSLRRLDSTKRIKKELRQKRSSFLGLEGNGDDSYLEPELDLIRPPDMTTLLAEERRIERQLYRQSVCSESDSNQESRDSGVELDHKHHEMWSHSRNDSETFGNQSTTSEEDEIMKKEREIIETLEQEEKIRKQDLGEKLAMRLRELEAEKDRIEWEHVQAESVRINQNHIYPKHNHISIEDLNKCRSQEQLDTEWCSPRSSLQDISHLEPPILNYRGEYRKSLGDLTAHHHQPNVRYAAHRRSMPNLQDVASRRPPPPPPPVLPMKSKQVVTHSIQPQPVSQHIAPIPQQRITNPQVTNHQQFVCPNGSSQMSRQALQALSAAPRSRLISADSWQVRKKQQRPDSYNYQHWLIQEAEHRRITEQQERTAMRRPEGSRQGGWPTTTPQSQQQHWGQQSRGKHLPDAIIQTLTQRVQSRLTDPNNNRRRQEVPTEVPYHHMSPTNSAKEKMLSVSGKKRCSHCGEELGRGAAMIIESLQLFYHIDCFKCCVCCIQLGDGLNGTDVRVRNNKLHCHNCYSSDDGAKFSCV